MKQCMDSDNLHRRLKKIVGQVQAIILCGIPIVLEAIIGLVTDFEMLPGKGVKAVIDGRSIYAGNEKYIKELAVAMNDELRQLSADLQTKIKAVCLKYPGNRL